MLITLLIFCSPLLLSSPPTESRWRPRHPGVRIGVTCSPVPGDILFFERGFVSDYRECVRGLLSPLMLSEYAAIMCSYHNRPFSCSQAKLTAKTSIHAWRKGGEDRGVRTEDVDISPKSGTSVQKRAKFRADYFCPR